MGTYRFAFDPFGGQGTRGDGRTTTESLELGVDDLAILVHLDLKLHDITASWSADQSGADVLVLLVEGADVARVLVVINDLKEK